MRHSIPSYGFALLILLSAGLAWAQTDYDQAVQESLGVVSEIDYTQWELINVQNYAQPGRLDSIYSASMAIGFETRPDAFSELSKAFYLQSRTPFTVGPDTEETIYMLMGNATNAYLILESSGMQTEWVVKIWQLDAAGYEQELLTTIVQSNEAVYFSAANDHHVKIDIIQSARTSTFPMSVWVTIVPELEMLAHIPSPVNGMPVMVRR